MDEGEKVPEPVRDLAAGDALRLVWHNEVHGLTFEAGAGERRRFIKWAPAGAPLDLPGEAARMTWAGAFTRVPRVLGQGSGPDGDWLVTSPLPGEMAVTPHWLARPEAAVTALGAGLRALHDALPAASCPFSWMAQVRLSDARRRAALGQVDPARWHSGNRPLGVPGALDRLADIPPPDRLVVCHGDSCAPNTLLTPDGRWSGHIDLGALGVADRWADLAVATWSTEWNYGPGWDRVLLDAYGAAPDPERTWYYRLLWDLAP